MNIAPPAASTAHHAAAGRAAGEAAAAAAAAGPASALGPSSPGVATPGAGSTGFTAELANDPLGLVASYLPQSDQLVMRQAGDAVRAVVDDRVRCLALTARQACDLLVQPDAFLRLDELRLTHCDDETLVALADILGNGARPAFALVLEGAGSAELSAVGLRAIVQSNVSRITLRELTVPPDSARALAESRVPVSISLPAHGNAHHVVYWISRIPTLTSLATCRQPLEPASVEALRAHAGLTTLSLHAAPADVLHTVAGSASLQSLAVHYASGDTARAFAALADSTTLTSVLMGMVTRAEDVAALARSRTMRTLTLHLGADTATGFPALAEMPALEHLTLRGWGERVPVAAEDIAAVCAKPLKSLEFDTLRMDGAAFRLVAASHAASLRWASDGMLTDAEATLLAANPWVSSVSLGPGMVSETGALLLARAPGLQRLEMRYSSAAPVVSKRRVTHAWTTAGKALADLKVEVAGGVGNDGAPLWA